MRVHKFCFPIIVSLFVFSFVTAQNTNLNKLRKDSLLNEMTDVHKRLKRISVKDSTTGFSAPLFIKNQHIGYKLTQDPPPRDSNGLLVLPDSWTPFDNNTLFSDTIIFDPVFLPVVFDGRILPNNMDFRTYSFSDFPKTNYHLIDPDSTFAPELTRAIKIQEMRRYYYQHNPLMIKLNALAFQKTRPVEESVVKGKNPFQSILSTDDPVEVSTPEVEKYVIKKVYWIKRGEHSLQINQNKLSENWFTGGDNNFNILNFHRLEVNYKKNKIGFDNRFEWKLNFQRTHADTKHKVTIMEDFLQTYTALNVEAYKKWSYTANLFARTPLFNSFPVNSNDKRAAIFSPLNVNTGIGMRYSLENVSKKDKYRRLDLKLDLSPVSINYTFVGDRGVDETRFGIEKGKMAKTDFGMTVIMNTTYGFNRYSSVTSRFKYFTSYEKVVMESENRFNMILNKYLSGSLYLYVRYDDGVPQPKDNNSKWKYFQYNEILGFGLNYKW